LYSELEAKLGPVLKDVGDFIRDDLSPAARRMWEIFKDVAKVLQDNQGEFKDLLSNMKDLAGFITDTLNPTMEDGNDYFSALEFIVAGTVGHLLLMVKAFNGVADTIRKMPTPPGWLLDLLGGGFGLTPGGIGTDSSADVTSAPSSADRRVTVDVNLNNGINTDPVAIGEAVATALRTVATAEQRSAS
jgi:hypothetical protein